MAVISKGAPDQMEWLLSGFQNCPFYVKEGRDLVLLQRAGNNEGRRGEPEEAPGSLGS